MYRQIMVPLDGSRLAESALPGALAISRTAGADVHVVTVADLMPALGYQVDDGVVRERAGQYLDRIVCAASGRTGGALTSAVLDGHVVEALEAEAEACHADIVVMTTHGRGVLSRAWLGSVADALLHDTNRTVLVVRPKEAEAPDLAEDVSFGRLLVPLDGSELSECILEPAIDFGTLYGASYHLVRIVSLTLDVSSPYLPTTFEMRPELVEEARTNAATYLEGHAGRMRARGLEVDVSARVELQTGPGILDEAEERGCGLIAMATHGRAGLRRAILGSTADKVLRATRLPLLLHRYHVAQ